MPQSYFHTVRDNPCRLLIEEVAGLGCANRLPTFRNGIFVTDKVLSAARLYPGMKSCTVTMFNLMSPSFLYVLSST